jgi:hypothetical protein
MSINKLFKSFQQERLKDVDFDIIEIDDLRISLPDIPRRKELIDKYLHSERSDEAKSFWSHLTKRINNVINYLKYNFITRNNYLILNNLKYIRIFDKIYADDAIKKQPNLIFKDIVQFTYRSFFDPIINKGVEYISDCGWGCMIRAAQMMLAKGILEKKKYDGVANYKNDTICLFYEKQVSMIDEMKVIGELFAPPFSIQNICNMGILYDKGAGIWFSDYIMIKIFKEINENLKIIDMEFIHSDAVINEEEIVKSCFTNLSCPHSDNICDDCLNKINTADIITFNKRHYIFKRGAFIFISVRLGLSEIDSIFTQSILHLFKMSHNLGIIGGQTNSALYFIGESADRLICLDPHFNQNTSLSPDTYDVRYLYEIDVTKISPAFTTGFYFRNCEEYKQLMLSFANHSSFNNPILKLSEIKKNKILVEEYEDDFCIINYQS